MKYKIMYVKKKEKFGFIGMNDLAAQAHRISYHHKEPAHVIEVEKKNAKGYQGSYNKARTI
jgi:hypothetical protein